jgi:hypothetical protein
MIGSVFAIDADPIVQTKLLLDQYSLRVKNVEAENTILREEMRKAGIKIPLSVFTAAVQTGTATTLSGLTASVTVLTGTTTIVPPVVVSWEVSYSYIEKTHGMLYVGFIKRLISEWDKVRDAYSMPKIAHIGWYEFVTTGALDHVFVDIIYTGSVSGTGIFDAKILYQFDKTTFARKLIGFFEYDQKTGFYITKTGKNVFPGVKRTWVADPRIQAVTTPTVTTGTLPVITNTGTTVTYTSIEAAYTAKRFLSVITLSNAWLISNPPTLDILRIRYRTYFIIAKYSEALKEIEKIRSIGQLSSAVACEWYVIATYAKDTTLADSYKTICNKK